MQQSLTPNATLPSFDGSTSANHTDAMLQDLEVSEFGLSPEPSPTAVIDVGSGSARAVVMQVNQGGGIEIIAQQRINLNLMSHLTCRGALDDESVASTVEAVEDFVQLAKGYGISCIHAVGTAALRESRNALEVTGTIARRFGVTLRVIDGYEEAAYCFLGSVHGLPVSKGLMADLGGGSMEVVEFADRSMKTLHSLPLGSLRIANSFRLTQRAAAEDVAAAHRYALESLKLAKVPALAPHGELVGSGGSMRLFAKLDRRHRHHPVKKIHGYCISRRALENLVNALTETALEERAQIPGMNPERTHSIVGGAMVALALLEHAGAQRIMLSGQGLREGLARNPHDLSMERGITLPPTSMVRLNTLSDLSQRFAPRYSRRGPRRSDLARRIAEAVWCGKASLLASSLQCAAFLLDVGSATDFYNRLNRTSSLVVASDLPGFSHRESAQITAILLAAERGRLPRKYRRSSLLSQDDRERIGQAAVILLTADELERRLPPDLTADAVEISSTDGGLYVSTPAWSKKAGRVICDRWQQEFGQPIFVRWVSHE
jgi:exopolyphosphatase/guanosine-5'-triphosphate,3'-diphosphate pyrophosphatase